MRLSLQLVMSLPSRERGLKYLVRKIKRAFKDVAPFAGAWIEIRQDVDSFVWTTVAPFAGAWIEIIRRRRRSVLAQVAPFAGAWIEIGKSKTCSFVRRVAPFAGAWIEILIIVCVDN